MVLPNNLIPMADLSKLYGVMANNNVMIDDSLVWNPIVEVQSCRSPLVCSQQGTVDCTHASTASCVRHPKRPPLVNDVKEVNM